MHLSTILKTISDTPTHTPARSLSHTHTHTHTLSLSHTHTLYLSLTHTYTLLSLTHTQDTGILLSQQPQPENSEVTGKAISLLSMQMILGQFLVATSMGFLITLFRTHRVILLVSFVGACIALKSATSLTVPCRAPTQSSLTTSQLRKQDIEFGTCR